MNSVAANQKIWEGKKKAFLVRDKSFQDSKAPFWEFLRSEGYTLGFHKGNYGCGWVHVDISTKQFAYGMPGVEIVGAIGNHAITSPNFVTPRTSGKMPFGATVISSVVISDRRLPCP